MLVTHQIILQEEDKQKAHIYKTLHKYLAFFQDKEYIIVPDGKIVQVPWATPLEIRCHKPDNIKGQFGSVLSNSVLTLKQTNL